MAIIAPPFNLESATQKVRLNEEAPLSRRRFLASTTAGVASALLTTQATADTLADVPPREVGADLSGHGERSKFVHLAMLPEAGPGKRNVDPSDAINSKAPLGKLVGTITPTDLHYERSHSGNPDLDPAKHRLLVHGMTRKQLVFTVDDLMRMPSITRTVFIECTGNGWENWKKADPNPTVQNTHGLVSTNEWTGVPLRFLIDLVGKHRRSTWMLAEGADAAGVDRSIPLTEEIMDEAFIAYGQNGEPLRPAHGFPIRLITPGLEGNLHIKWLRRLKFGDQPWMTRWETDRYTQLLANGKAMQFQLRMETNSVITSPSGMMEIRPGSFEPSRAAEGADALPDGLGVGRKADQDRQPLHRRKGQCSARPQVVHHEDGNKCAVPLQRPADLEHRRRWEGSQCSRLSNSLRVR